MEELRPEAGGGWCGTRRGQMHDLTKKKKREMKNVYHNEWTRTEVVMTHWLCRRTRCAMEDER
jgi:hypothetical protein